MCLQYGGTRQPAYVRACYRTGRRGAHIPLADAQTLYGWTGSGCLGFPSPRSARRSPRGPVHFALPDGTHPDEIAYVARRGGADQVQETTLAGRRYVSLARADGQALPLGDILRGVAQSFRWHEVPWQAGLPGAEANPPGTAGTPRARRGRIVGYYLDAVPPAETPAEALAPRAAQLGARAYWETTNGLRYGVFRFACGFDRAELAAYEALLHAAGWHRLTPGEISPLPAPRPMDPEEARLWDILLWNPDPAARATAQDALQARRQAAGVADAAPG